MMSSSFVMQLGDLRAFAIAVELSGVTRAARRLNLVQSAVSQAVARLERESGLELLERRPDGVRPTEAGAALAAHANTVLRAVARAERDLAAFRGLEQGTVHLGVLHTALPLLLTPLLRRLRERHPGLTLRVQEAMAPRIIELVVDGGLDLAVVFSPAEVPGLVVTDVCDLELSVVAAPGDDSIGLRLADLTDRPWIAFPPDNPGRQWLEKACARAGFRPRIAEQVTTLTELKAFVESGIGLAMLPPSAAQPEVAAGRLLAVAPAGRAVTVPVGYVHARHALGPAVAAVRDLIVDGLTELPESRQRLASSGDVAVSAETGPR
jgi:LysR family transcriptional regulator, nitrogen assimilation regulatory protein